MKAVDCISATLRFLLDGSGVGGIVVMVVVVVALNSG